MSGVGAVLQSLVTMAPFHAKLVIVAVHHTEVPINFQIALAKELSFEMSLAYPDEFPAVIAACAAASRPEQEGTWISPAVLEASRETPSAPVLRLEAARARAGQALSAAALSRGAGIPTAAEAAGAGESGADAGSVTSSATSIASVVSPAPAAPRSPTSGDPRPSPRNQSSVSARCIETDATSHSTGGGSGARAAAFIHRSASSARRARRRWRRPRRSSCASRPSISRRTSAAPTKSPIWHKTL
jgi:hypothetical protein